MNALKWKCVLWGNHLYGNKGNHLVSDDTKFRPFLEAAIQCLTSKINIKITMDDPNKSAKNVKQVCVTFMSPPAQRPLSIFHVMTGKSIVLIWQAGKSLALSYGPEDDFSALERTHACLAVNTLGKTCSTACS